MAARAQLSSSAQGRQLASNPGFYLRTDSAIAWDRAVDKFGKKVLITGALRSRETQVRLFTERYKAGAYSPFGDYRYWNGVQYGRTNGAAAAVPGTSNHGSGDAVDVKTARSPGDPGRETAVIFTGWGDPDRTRFLKVAAEYGWADDEGRRVNEVWHLTYYPERDKHRDTGGGGTSSDKKRKPHRIATVKRGKLLNGAWRVRLVQGRLNGLGIDVGKVDGKFGPGTERGVSVFQRKRDLTADGVVGPATWYELVRGARPGVSGVAVKIAQRILGLTGKAVDGEFGPTTTTRAKEVQRWLGVTPDADFGPATVKRLIEKG